MARSLNQSWVAILGTKIGCDEDCEIKKAVRYARLDVVKRIISRDANALNRKNFKTLLGLAVRNQDYAMCKLLITAAPELRSQNFVYLCWCLMHEGMNGTMELLVNKGIDVNAQGATGGTILHVACKHDRYYLVKLLIERGADVNIADDWGATPFLEAAGSGNFDIVQLLLSHGADINVTDHMERNALHYLCYFSREDSVKVARLLLSLDFGLETLDRLKNSPLQLAIVTSKRKIPEFLIENGANVNSRNVNGETPLVGCVEHLDPSFAKYLIKQGARVNEVRDDNMSCLHIAFNLRLPNQIRALLSHGAKLYPNEYYIVPFFYLCPVLIPEVHWIVQEMVRLETMGGYVCLVDKDLVLSEPESKSHYDLFVEELELTKRVETTSYYTLYDSFKRSENFTANLLKDKRIIRKLENMDMATKFPLWHRVIINKLVACLKLREVMEYRERELIGALYHVLPISAIERIAYFLQKYE
ncbi:hypothetical protein QAD02_021503 [Eretmocerus hayati]|uniref:Uncharacterized protein n=1 Tax=Eretmocerus hayati TaxID=131215 RepID=A0ACC2PV88_9HYME|nr:hypothetical protein QAD02_021503 [Eretmocerus hayati]